MMKEYEVVHEILNECERNKTRDIFVEEIEIPEGAFEEYLRTRHRDRELELVREDLADGSVKYTVQTSGITQRYTFTEF